MTTISPDIPDERPGFWRRLRKLPAALGPMLNKEMLISSRRKRYYFLRLVYLGLLTLIVSIAWGELADFGGETGSRLQSRMSDAGRGIVTTFMWFQFVAAQLAAVVLMSSAVSGEVQGRTLTPLLSTPLSPYQVVLGKLLGGLVQVLILLASTLPLLAVVRIFGGVPWGLVVTGIAATLSGALISGTVALFYSTLLRRSYGVILASLGTLVLLYGVLPMQLAIPVGLLTQVSMPAFCVVCHLHPVSMMGLAQADFSSPGMGLWLFWPLHLAAMTAAALLLLRINARLLRKVALPRSMGDDPQGDAAATPAPVPPPALAPYGLTPGLTPAELGDVPPIQDVRTMAAWEGITGSPVLWRELKTPITRSSTIRLLLTVLLSVLLITVYGLSTIAWALGGATEMHPVFLSTYLVLLLAALLISCAGSLTSEKEARTWPVLVATPLGDWEILWGKAAGVLRRARPLLILMGAHLVLFTFVVHLHPVVVLHVSLIVAGAATLAMGAGLYFSARFRRTTSAVIACLVLVLVLWVLAPMAWDAVDGPHGPLDAMGLNSPQARTFGWLLTPAVQVFQASYGGLWSENHAGFWPGGLRYRGVDSPLEMSVFEMTALVATTAAANAAAGLLLARAAARRLRRDVF